MTIIKKSEINHRLRCQYKIGANMNEQFTKRYIYIYV